MRAPTKRQDVATKPETRAQLVLTLRDAFKALTDIYMVIDKDYENPLSPAIQDILDRVAVRRIGSVLRQEESR